MKTNTGTLSFGVEVSVPAHIENEQKEDINDYSLPSLILRHWA